MLALEVQFIAQKDKHNLLGLNRGNVDHVTCLVNV